MFFLIFILLMSLSFSIYNYNVVSMTGNLNSVNKVEAVEIQAFNEPLIQYEGEKIGSQVKSLLSVLITNAGNNADNGERLLDLIYIDENLNETVVISDVDDTAIAEVSTIKAKIDNKHYYNVEFEYDYLTGYVSDVKILY